MHRDLPIVPGGFEPPSRAPKALRIDLYPTGLTILAALTNLDLLLPALLDRPAAMARCVRITYIWPFPEISADEASHQGACEPEKTG